MSNIGAISVLISANTAQFEKGLKAALKDLQAFGDAAVSATGYVTAMGAAAIAAAGAGLAVLTAESMKSIDTANDLSQELQANINDIRAYGYAAQVNGSSVEDFNNALRKMQKTIGEASSGDQGAIDNINALGLSLESIKGKSATDNFRSIAQSIMQIKDPAQQAAASVAIFGKSGQGMLNTFAGLDDAAESFKRLRGELSALDVANVAAANDAMDDFKNVLGAIGDALATKVSPYITGFLKSLQALTGTGDALKSNVGAAFETIVGWAIRAGDVVDGLKLAFAELNLTLAKANYLYEAQNESLTHSSLFGKMGKAESEAEQAEAAISAGEALKLFTAAQDEATKARENFANANTSQKIKKVLDEMKELGTVKNTGGWFDDMDGGTASFDTKAGEASRKASSDLAKNIGKTINDAIKAEQDWDEKLAKAQQDYIDGEEKKQDAIKDTAKQLRDSLRSASQVFEDEGSKILENKFLSADEKRKLLDKKALELAGTTPAQGTAQAIDRNLNIEGLRQNAAPKKQEVTDPQVLAVLNRLDARVAAQENAAKVGAN